MSGTSDFGVVLVTAPDRRTARRLAREVVGRRLAACANLVSGIESIYWWQGRIETGRETLMILKTTRSRWPALMACLREHHPYDTPEIVRLPIAAGDARYLRWLRESVRPPAAAAAGALKRKTAPANRGGARS
ncbi:MAG: divalent-cation tolerance protein CutA [Verrucomicrobia bacterium]|nr:divalent-cation tolerance protein CutA [Verrucomicrobiota bacterium]